MVVEAVDRQEGAAGTGVVACRHRPGAWREPSANQSGDPVKWLWRILSAVFVAAVLGAGALAYALYNEGMDRDRARGLSGLPWDAEAEPEYGCWRDPDRWHPEAHEHPCEDAP